MLTFIIFKHRVHIWLYVLGISPPCGTVFYTLPELLGILDFVIHYKTECYATLSQKYPTKIYGRFKSTSFLVSIPPAFAFRFLGIAFRSLVIPSMMLLKGSAPCPYSFPGSVLCSYSVIPHLLSISVSPLQKSCPFVFHYHKQIP